MDIDPAWRPRTPTASLGGEEALSLSEARAAYGWVNLSLLRLLGVFSSPSVPLHLVVNSVLSLCLFCKAPDTHLHHILCNTRSL